VKSIINKIVITDVPQARGGMVTSNDTKLAQRFEQEFMGRKLAPIIYWMGWGTVPFANHEIAFRKLRYVEAFEYDYTYVKLDILDPQYLSDAVLIYPTEKMVDILQVEPTALDNQKKIMEGRLVQRVGLESGVAVLGTGWLPPTVEASGPVRYLRSSQEGGLVIWSPEPKVIEIELEASGVEPGMSLTLRRSESENSSIFSGNETIFRRNTETSLQYFARLKSYNYKFSGSKDILYSLEIDMQMHNLLTPLAFNKYLSTSKLFKSFVIHNLENESELTMDLHRKYQSQQLTYGLNLYRDRNPTTIKFNFELHKGVNVLRFISRDSQGRRAGRDPLNAVPYNQGNNVPSVAVSKIKINNKSQSLNVL
jgi:hypothetical protein